MKLKLLLSTSPKKSGGLFCDMNTLKKTDVFEFEQLSPASGMVHPRVTGVVMVVLVKFAGPVRLNEPGATGTQLVNLCENIVKFFLLKEKGKKKIW